MGPYHTTRNEIKRVIIFELTDGARRKGVPPEVDLTLELEPRAEQLLAEFERLAAKNVERSWWYGVGQSIAGSFLVFVVLGFAANAILGSRQDPRDLATGKVNSSSPAATATASPLHSAAVTPTPTPTAKDLSNQPDAP